MVVTNQEWIWRGRAKGKDGQKKLLAQALRKPMTVKELLTAMRLIYPTMGLRDVTRLLRKFEERNLIQCLTPKETEGRYYYFTDSGRRLTRKAFGMLVKPIPRLINWPKYARATRSQIRRLVLLALNSPWPEKGMTITAVRKRLNEKYPVALGVVSRAMRELRDLNLIRHIGLARKRSSPIYAPTLIGRRIINLLSASN